MKTFFTTLIIFFTSLLQGQEYIYWSDFNSNGVFQSDYDGSNVTTLNGSIGTPRGLIYEPSENILFGVNGTVLMQNVFAINLNPGGRNERLASFSNPTNLAIDFDTKLIYVADPGENAIFTMNYDGSSKVKILENLPNAGDLAISKKVQKLFWVDRTELKIYRSDLDGQNVETLVDNNTLNMGITVSDEREKFYIADRTNSQITSYNFDGSDPTKIADADEKCHGVNYDSNRDELYWLDFATQRIRRMDLQSNEIVTVQENITGLNGFAFQTLPKQQVNAPSSNLYWTDFGDETINRLNENTTDLETLTTTDVLPRGIAIDPDQQMVFHVDGSTNSLNALNLISNQSLVINTYSNPVNVFLDTENQEVYVTDAGSSAIVKCDYDGNNSQALITTANPPADIFIDFGLGKIFWNEVTTQTDFYQSNLDGSNVENLFDVNADVLGFTFDYVENKFYMSDRSNEEIRRSNMDGTDLETIAAASAKVGSTTLDQENRILYWAENDNGRIQSLDLSSGNLTTTVDQLSGVSGIALEQQNTSNVNLVGRNLNINIYPNPTSKSINFESLLENPLLNIFSLDGKKVITQKGVLGQNEIDVSILPLGSYFLEISNNEVKGSFHFVIQ